MTPAHRPVVLVPACRKRRGTSRIGESPARPPIHWAGAEYTDAVRLAGGLPLIVPAARHDEIDDLLALADGILLSGSPSNVHPRHFDAAVHDTSLPLDPARDDWTLPLIPRALALGIPLFAICRGLQEVNVALGGSLHQAVHDVPGCADHRADSASPVDAQYAVAHEVEVRPGGVLAALTAEAHLAVNSLHGQGVNRLAAGLRVEAVAPDGLIEAFSVEAAPGFNLCVQWHPEWQAASNPVAMRLLQAFGAACRSYRARKVLQEPPCRLETAAT